MKKSVIYLSAFVMFAAVIAMSVGFSAAWFANITESSSPIKIGSGEDSAFIIISTGAMSGGNMKPAVFVDGYTVSKYYDPGNARDVLNADLKVSNAPEQPLTKKVFKENASKITYSSQFYFDGQPDPGSDRKLIQISIEGVYDKNPVNSNFPDIPLDIKNRGTDYIEHVSYKLSCSYNIIFEQAQTQQGDQQKEPPKELPDKPITVRCPVGKNVNIPFTCDFYYNKADEELPSILIDKPLFILLKIQAIKPGETIENN